MARGLVSGVLWGSLISLMSLWLLSQIGGMVGLLSEPPQDVAVVAPDVVKPVLSDQDADTPVAPDSQGGPATDPSRQGTGLNAANTDDVPSADTDPAQVPDASDVAAGQSSPGVGTAPVLQPSIQTPTVPDAVATALIAPGGEAVPVATEAPPAPLAPPVISDAPESPIVTEEPPVAALVPDTSPPVSAQPEQPPNPVAEVVPENDFSTPTVVATPEPEADLPVPDTEQAATNGDPAPPPATSGNAVVVDRSGGSNTETDVPDPDTGAQGDGPDTETAEAAATGPAIEIYAEEFDNPEGRPLMAILLLPPADGADAISPDAALPFPVSYAVDGSKQNATALMQAFRAAGSEVAVLTPLPEGAAPKDVEVAFQSYFAAVPESVAAVDVPAAVFQSGRDVATQVAEALAASGRGMVTYSRGLNSATQVAERAGVPAALVFRVLDDNGRDTAAIKRFLDQAAFRAGQQTGVVLVGRNRAETRAALLEWALGNRAGTVALAPLSVVLLDR